MSETRTHVSEVPASNKSSDFNRFLLNVPGQTPPNFSVADCKGGLGRPEGRESTLCRSGATSCIQGDCSNLTLSLFRIFAKWKNCGLPGAHIL